MFTYQNKIDIYSGQGRSKTLIWSSQAPVSGKATKIFTSSEQTITVVISGGSTDTKWKYDYHCNCKG